MKLYCIESTFDFEAENFFIRVWRNEPQVPARFLDMYNEDLLNLLFVYRHTIDPAALIDAIGNIPRINAIQIKTKGTNSLGIMVYTVPFAEDKQDANQR